MLRVARPFVAIPSMQIEVMFLDKVTVQHYTVQVIVSITIHAYQLKLITLGGKVRTALPDRRRILVPFSVTSSV